MKNLQKGIAPIIIALIVAVVLGGGYAVFKFSQNYQVLDKGGIPHQVISENVDWKTYTDANMGVSVKYPSSWTYQTFSCNIDGVAFCPLAGNSLLNCKQTCGMDSPASPIYLYGGKTIVGSNLQLNSTDYEYKKIYDRMLSTFKFTQPATTTTNKSDITTTVDCKDANCFNQKFISCEPATLQADDGVGYGAANYKIIGKTATGCNITFKYTKYPDPALMNKEMTCEFDNKIDFTKAFGKVFSDISVGTVVCKGPLYDILRPHN